MFKEMKNGFVRAVDVRVCFKELFLCWDVRTSKTFEKSLVSAVHLAGVNLKSALDGPLSLLHTFSGLFPGPRGLTS